MHSTESEDGIMKNTGKFILDGLILSAVSLLLRSAGVFFNAYVSGKTGAAGTGLLTLVGSVYGPALTLSTAGVNLAVSRIAAEELCGNGACGVRQVVRNAVCYAILVSTSVGVLLLMLSGYIATEWLGDADAAGLLRLLALGLPLQSLSSAMSGYFTAVRRVAANAAVTVIGETVKTAVTLSVLSGSIGKDSRDCLLAVLLCSFASDGLSCILHVILCRIDRRRLGYGGERHGGIMKRILSVTVPVSVSSFLRSGLVALEHILIPMGLVKKGVSHAEAMAAYGVLGGMAMPIIMFPASFLYSFTGLLIPEFAEANGCGDINTVRETAEKTVKAVLGFSIGAAAIIMGFSYDLGMAVYGSAYAGRCIKVLAPLIPIMYLDTAVDSALKGIGEQVYTMKVNIADALLSVIAVWLLVPILGLDGYIAVIFISEIFNFTLSIRRLSAVTGMRTDFVKGALFPLISAALSVGASLFTVRKLLLFPAGTARSAVMGITLSVGLLGVMYYIRRSGEHSKNERHGILCTKRFSNFFLLRRQMRSADSERSASAK